MKRPSSLSEVAGWSTDSRTFHYHLADFLDQFRLEARGGMLAEEPPLLAGRFERGDVCDAYLAATALTLAREISAIPPAWAWKENRKLRLPMVCQSGTGHSCDAAARKPWAISRTEPIR